MTSQQQNEAGTPPSHDGETTGNAKLDARLSKGVIDFSHGSERAQVWIGAFLIVVTGGLVYMNAFTTPFQGRDLELIVENTSVHRLVTAPAAFAFDRTAPLAILSYALNWTVSPDNPAVFHLVNVLLHVLNGVLLYLLTRRLLPVGTPEPVAMLAGLLLVAHPLASESVLLVSGRPGLLATSFCLLALIALMRPSGQDPAPRPWALLAAGACYFLAYASESSALILPLLAFPLAWAGPHMRHRRLAACGMLLGLMALLGVVHLAADAHAGAESISGWLSAAGAAAARFGRLFVAPIGLNVVAPEVTASSGSMYGLVLLGVLLCVGLGLTLWRSLAGPALLWLGLGICGAALLLPSSEVLAERRAYFLLAGPLLLMPWLLSRIPVAAMRTAAGVAAAALVLSGASLAYERSLHWHDAFELWTDAAEKAPHAAEPHVRLARYFEQQAGITEDPEDRAQLLRQAAADWRTALESSPKAPASLTGYGRVLRLLAIADPASPIEEAIAQLKDALRLDPSRQEAAIQLGLALAERAGKADDRESLYAALDYLEHAETLGPLPPPVQAQLGLALAGIGDVEGGLRRLLAAGPDNVPGGQDLIDRFSTVAARVRALDAEVTRGLVQNAANPDLPLRQAELNLLRGQLLQAAYFLDVTLRARPDNTAAWQMLGVVRANMRDAESFAREWGSADAATAEAWRGLAEQCARAGQWGAARRYIERSVAGVADATPVPLQLADIASAMGATQQATLFYREAAEALPESPLPWLGLADLELAADDSHHALEYLDQAERRGADPDGVRSRRDKIQVEQAPVRSVIR